MDATVHTHFFFRGSFRIVYMEGGKGKSSFARLWVGGDLRKLVSHTIRSYLGSQE